MSLLDFRIFIVEGLSGDDKIEIVQDKIIDSNNRLHGKHFLRLIEDNKRRKCEVCSVGSTTGRVRSKYECSTCLVSLCPTDCFRKFHTLAKYK